MKAIFNIVLLFYAKIQFNKTNCNVNLVFNSKFIFFLFDEKFEK